MGECRQCHRKGLFVLVNSDGLCSRCAKESQDSGLTEAEIQELDRQARARSEQFSKVHKTALKEFSQVNTLRKIQPGQPGPLSLEEILFLWYLDGTDASADGIAGYWTHDYHIDYGSVSKKLFSYGYLTFANTEVKLSNQKVPELKKLLADNGLPVSGRKDALVQRILENILQEKIDQVLSGEYFALTPAGADLVAANDHLVYVHRHRAHFDVSLKIADDIKNAHPKYSCYDVARAALERDGRRFYKAKDWGLWRNTLYNRSVVYQEQGDTAPELKLLLQVSYLDARGYGNNDSLEPHLAILAPAIVSRITRLCKEQQIGKDALYNKFQEAVSDLDIRDKSDVEEAFIALWKEIGQEE